MKYNIIKIIYNLRCALLTPGSTVTTNQDRIGHRTSRSCQGVPMFMCKLLGCQMILIMVNVLVHNIHDNMTHFPKIIRSHSHSIIVLINIMSVYADLAAGIRLTLSQALLRSTLEAEHSVRGHYKGSQHLSFIGTQ